MIPKPVISTVTILILLTITPFLQTSTKTDTPRNAGKGEFKDISGITGKDWSIPNEITTPGFPYATVDLGINEQSSYLWATKFGFDIPAGSTIRGITVMINRKASEPRVKDFQVRLIKDDIVQSGDRSSDEEWTTDFITATYGAPHDLWGTSWKPEDINDEDFGVALAVENKADGSRAAEVDVVQVMVHYSLPDTETSVACGSEAVATYGEGITCEATVKEISGSNLPQKEIQWSTDSGGVFDPGICTLVPSDSGDRSTCSAVYTPNNVGTGFHTITATYSGDNNYSGSSGAQTITVKKAIPRLFINNSPVIYDGLPQDAEVRGSVEGTPGNIVFAGIDGRPVHAGSYAVSADFFPDDQTNYETLEAASAGNFVIDRRPITATADAKMKIIGEADPELTYTISGGSLLNGDTCSGELDREPGEEAGDYKITQGTLKPPSEDYILSFISGILTIRLPVFYLYLPFLCRGDS